MASCDEIFQRKLALDLERQQNDAELDRLRQIRASRAPDPWEVSDEDYLKAQQIAEERMAANEQVAAEGIDQQVKSNEQRAADGKSPKPDPAVNIYDGQPINFQKLVRENPESIAEGQAYAARMISMMDAQSALKPDEITKGAYSNPRRRAELTADLTDKSTPENWIRAIANATEGFRTVIADATVVRYINDTVQSAYGDAADEVLAFVRANPGAAVDAQAKRKLFNHFKVAFQAARHYNYVRGAWGRLGHVLKERSVADSIMEFTDPDVLSAVEEISTAQRGSGAMTVINESAELTPEALNESDSISEVFRAIDKAQTDPGAAVEQLELAVKNIRLTGADPRMMTAEEMRNVRARNFNAMTKDSQLFNERTNALNFGSNAIMAVYGSTRRYFEDVMEFQEIFGTRSIKPWQQAWQANFDAVKYSVNVTRDAGKTLFMDAFARGINMYGSNADTYGRKMRPVSELVKDYEDMLKGGFDRKFSAELNEKDDNISASGNRAFRRGLSLINPERHARFAKAAFRLFMYNKTGDSFFLRPGFRTMGAVDNVSGYYATMYKLRHDLEMEMYKLRHDLEVEARKGGKQLNFEEAENPQRAMNEWIEGELQKAMYSAEPTDADIIAYRKETGMLTQELADDETIAIEIMRNRISREHQVPAGEQGPSGGDVMYRGLVPSSRTRSASEFSEEMRFTSLPGEPGSGVRKTFNALNSVRNSAPWIESTVPYFTAPLSGAALTVELTGISPAIKLAVTTGTAKQIRRNKATLAMAGFVYAMWAPLSMGGLIVDNGPLDPKRRQQWKLKLKREGKIPNSIAGIPMMGGFPIIENFLLLEGFKNEMQRAAVSRFDQIKFVEAIVGTTAGYLARASALGQVQQIMEVVYGNPYQQSRLGNLVGFFAAGRGYLGGIPSGPMRSLERASASSQHNLYRDAKWTENDYELFDRDQMEKWESTLRDFAYNYTGLAGAFGGQYKDKDWLGFDIRFPWGMDFATYLKKRFTPMEHPDSEKVYQHLYDLDMLDPPTELISIPRRLRGVPMSDDLQKLWNDSYGEIKGEIDPTQIVQEVYTVKLPLFDVTHEIGVRRTGSTDLISIDVAKFLGQFTTGNTPYEALRALINSDIYQKMEDKEEISTRTDRPPAEKRKKPAALMVNAIKRYYAELTTARMMTMDDPPEFVTDWRNNVRKKNAFDQQQALDEAGAAATIPGLEAEVKAFTDAVSGAQ